MELKECPFCGSAKVEPDYAGVCCLSCGARGPASNWAADKATNWPGTIGLWNRRSVTPRLEALEKVAKAAANLVEKYYDKSGMANWRGEFGYVKDALRKLAALPAPKSAGNTEKED